MTDKGEAVNELFHHSAYIVYEDWRDENYTI